MRNKGKQAKARESMGSEKKQDKARNYKQKQRKANESK